jgi:hypothetical protein
MTVRLQLINGRTGSLSVPKDIMLQQRLQKKEEFSVEADGDTRIVYTRLKSSVPKEEDADTKNTTDV